jgi:RNA polymerase sigma factor (TIGR02999 family)
MTVPAGSDQPTEITILLEQIRAGTPGAENRLFELIYAELRRMAASRMRFERGSHTLSATALVHEAFMRMAGTEERISNRAHFFAVAAKAVRNILVDHARARRAAKRGAAMDPVALEGLDVPAPQSDEELINLDAALDRLASMSPRQARVVELRFFAGLSEEEVATVLDVTRRTVN